MLIIVNDIKFKERLKELREKLNISQRKLSSDLELGTTSVYFYESGKKVPSIEVLYKLSVYFEVSSDYLLGLTDIPNIKGEVPIDYNTLKEKAGLLDEFRKEIDVLCNLNKKYT